MTPEPDAALRHVAHVRQDVTGVEVAHVNVLDNALDRRQRRPAKRPIDEQSLGVRTVYRSHAAADPAAERQRLARAAELEPIAVQVVAQRAHAGHAIDAATRLASRTGPFSSGHALAMNEPGNLEVRSNEAGAFLTVVRDPQQGPHADEAGYWNTVLSCGPLNASLRFYELSLGGLVEYFEALAENWRGWSGERRWKSLEGDVELIAMHDGLGTITQRANLRREAFGQHRWSAGAELLLDAGGLDNLARQARLLL